MSFTQQPIQTCWWFHKSEQGHFGLGYNEKGGEQFPHSCECRSTKYKINKLTMMSTLGVWWALVSISIYHVYAHETHQLTPMASRGLCYCCIYILLFVICCHSSFHAMIFLWKNLICTIKLISFRAIFPFSLSEKLLINRRVGIMHVALQRLGFIIWCRLHVYKLLMD